MTEPNLNAQLGSYGLKHRAANDIGYSTNGIFIAAGLSAGFEIERDIPNVYFNINLKPFRCQTDSFNAYVINRHVRDNPRGDFIKDFKADDYCLSYQFNSKSELVEYLNDHNACSEAIQQAKRMWAEYQRHSAE